MDRTQYILAQVSHKLKKCVECNVKPLPKMNTNFGNVPEIGR